MDDFGIPHIAYYGLIIALAGMGIGALAIWTEHKRKEKTLEVLRTYAEKGVEPPAAMLQSLNEAANDKTPDDGTSETGWRKFILMSVMGLGFAGMALWTHSWSDRNGGWPFTLGFGITAFVLIAVGLSKLPQALNGPKKHGR